MSKADKESVNAKTESLTFDLSGVPKARPLEGRVRRRAHGATLEQYVRLEACR